MDFKLRNFLHWSSPLGTPYPFPKTQNLSEKYPSKPTPPLIQTYTKLSFTPQIYNHAINMGFTRFYDCIWVCPFDCFIPNEAFTQIFTPIWVKSEFKGWRCSLFNENYSNLGLIVYVGISILSLRALLWLIWSSYLI